MTTSDHDLTPRQRDILTVIHDEITATGTAPTFKEIAPLVGLSSVGGIQHQMRSLTEAGYLTKGPRISKDHPVEIAKPFTSNDGRTLQPLKATTGLSRNRPQVLNEEQEQILALVKEHIESTGTPPTYRHIAETLMISVSTVNYRLKGIREYGADGHPEVLEILGPQWTTGPKARRT